MNRFDKINRLALISTSGLLAFNFPFIYLFGKGTFLAGIPLLYWYVLVCWIAVIALTAWLTNRPGKKLS